MVLRGHDRHLAHVVRKFEATEKLPGLLGVRLHVGELGIVELARFRQNFVAHGDLAVVVEERRRPKLLELDAHQTHPASDHFRVARDPLAVAGGLLVAGVDRDGESLDQRFPKTLLAGEQLRVLDGDGGRGSERAQRLFVVRGEMLPALLVHDLEHTDDAIVLTGHREGEQASRAIAAALVGLGIEPRIRVCVGYVDRLPRSRDRPRDPDPHRQADLANTRAERDARPELVLLAIDDEDRRAVRIEQRCRRLGHVAQERVQIGDRHEPAGHVQDEVELRPRGHLAVGLPARLRAPLAFASLVRHQPSMGMCSSTGPTVSAICSSSIWSRRSNAPFRLFSAWMTPTTLWPSLPQTGTTSMFKVRNPVRRSTLRSKRASAYASGTLIVSPVSADCPARPWPIGSRISVAVRWATRAQSSFFFPFTM